MNIPTIGEELHRKTFKTLDYLTVRASKGLISQAEFSAGVDAVWMTSSGLVGESLVAVITDASELAKEADRSVCKALRGRAGLVIVRWTPGGDRIECLFPNKTEYKIADPIDLPTLAEIAIKKLKKAGYQEV